MSDGLGWLPDAVDDDSCPTDYLNPIDLRVAGNGGKSGLQRYFAKGIHDAILKTSSGRAAESGLHGLR
ncbi:MAG: hypothetical protein MK106_01030 [Mariniblastus sp.]|nr:hypothetical protein [Mariniblastus sp.]